MVVIEEEGLEVVFSGLLNRGGGEGFGEEGLFDEWDGEVKGDLVGGAFSFVEGASFNDFEVGFEGDGVGVWGI